jgi:hypothetical protein
VAEPTPNDLVYAVNTDGETVRIPKAQSQDAVAQGFTTPSDEQVAKYKVDARNAGVGGALKSAAEGAASTLLPGIAPTLERAAGVNPEDIESRERTHPWAHAAGTAAAVVGGSLVGDEAGAVGAISKAGRGVEGLIKGGGEGVVRRIAAKTAGSAVEGALYSTGNVLNEAALGDPNLTAQSALSEVGLGAILGGGLGGLVGSAEESLPAVVRSARDATRSLRDTIIEKYPQLHGVVSGGGEAAEADAAAAMSNRHVDVRGGSSDQEARELVKGLNDQHQAVEAATRDAFSEYRPAEVQLAASANPVTARAEFQKVADKLDATISQMRETPELYPARYAKKLEGFAEGLKRDLASDTPPEEIYKRLTQLNQNFDTQIKFGKMVAAEDLDAQSAVRTLRGAVKDSLENASVWGEAAERQAAFNRAFSERRTATDNLMKKLGKKVIVRGGRLEQRFDPVKVNTFLNQAEELRGGETRQLLQEYQDKTAALVDEIEHSSRAAPGSGFERQGLDELGEQNVKGVEDVRQRRGLLAQLEEMRKQPKGDGGMGFAVGALSNVPVVGHAIAGTYAAAKSAKGLYRMATNPVEAAATLAKLERAGARVSSAIDTAVGTLVRGSVKASYIGRGEVAAGLASSFSKGHDDGARAYQKRVDLLQKLSDPQALMGHVSQGMNGLQSHAPQTALATAATQSRAIAFLASKVEQHPPQGPLDPKWTPSPTEVATFNRYAEAVDNPLGIIKQAAAGTITPEAVEAVRTVYPELYQQVVKTVTEKLSARMASGETVPYASKLGLTALVGTPMDATMTPGSVAAAQLVWGGTQPQTKTQGVPGAIKPSKGMGKLDVSNRSLTGMQQSQQRKKT